MEHNWEKTNSTTLRHGTQLYDAFECKACGVTGKIHRRGQPVQLDRKFKPKAFRRCDTAVQYLAERDT